MQALIDFIRHARSRGMDAATIRVMLGAAGWKDRDVAVALAREGLELPIPEPRSAGTLRELFQHLLTFGLLYVVLVNLVLLYFGYLDAALPDPAEAAGLVFDRESMLSQLRWSLATVVIAFPLFLAISRSLLRGQAGARERTRSNVRWFFTWLTLFIAAVTALFNLITLVFFFLEGELTLRFALKSAILFLIAGTVFAYYFLAQRLEEQEAS